MDEYYEYDPDNGTLEIWQRDEGRLRPIAFVDGWRSPLLGITLRLETNGDLSVFYPDGSRFLPPAKSRRMAREAMTEATQERGRAEQEHERAEQEHERAEQEKARAEQAEQDLERLAAKLRALGIDPTTL